LSVGLLADEIAR